MEKKNICRTAVGIAVQASKLLGRPYVYRKYTTMNERLDINPEAHAELTTPPDIKYWCIGRGGHRVHVDDSDTPIMDPISHETTDTGPYKAVPFVLRRTNDDLSATDREKYILRRKETHNGNEYWAYYGKRFEDVKSVPEIIHDNTKNGITTSRVFEYTNDDLYPTPPDLPNEGVTVASDDIIRISSKVVIDFNERDVEEYYKVSKILYGSESSSIISEILICSGVDKMITVTGSSGSTFQFKDAIGVQVNVFVSTYQQISDNNRGFYHEFELGEGEPLLTRGETRSTRYSLEHTPTAEAATLAGTAYDSSNHLNGKGVSTTASINAENNSDRTTGQPVVVPAN